MFQFDVGLILTDCANLDLGGANIVTHTGSRGLFYATAANTVQLISPFSFEANQERTDSAGAVTNAVQPAFRATNEAVSNVTGDSTTYTVVFATEVFDQGSDFDGVSTFTAPITGRYLLTTLIAVTGLTVNTVDAYDLTLVTSNDSYAASFVDVDYDGTAICVQATMVVDMDSSDTATVTIDFTGDSGGKVNDIAAGAAHFSGALLV